METRKKIAIYLDYTLRVPNFKVSYDAFKSEMFSDKDFDQTPDDEIQPGDTRFFWRAQLKDPKVEAFYVGKSAPEDDYEMRGQEMSSYFYSDEHYRKFVDEYSFNLYTDCVVPNTQDLDIINLAQVNLFEIFIIDQYQSKRKISNTFFFLAKNRLYPQAVVLLNEGNKINEDSYFGVWNPKVNKEQTNGKGNKAFLNWFIDLEKKNKDGKI